MSLLASIQGLAQDQLQTEQAREMQQQQALRDAAQAFRGDRSGGLPSINRSEGASFQDMIEGLVASVDEKQKASRAETRAVLTGESTNLHRAVIAGQEASISFSLMVEVRNKLQEAYQELMRMQV